MAPTPPSQPCRGVLRAHGHADAAPPGLRPAVPPDPPTSSPAVSTGPGAPAAAPAQPPPPLDTPTLHHPSSGLAERAPCFHPASEWPPAGSATLAQQRDALLPAPGASPVIAQGPGPSLLPHSPDPLSGRVGTLAWEPPVAPGSFAASPACVPSELPIWSSAATAPSASPLHPVFSSTAPEPHRPSARPSAPEQGAATQAQIPARAPPEQWPQMAWPPHHQLQPPSASMHPGLLQQTQLWPAPADYFCQPRAGQASLLAGSPDRMTVLSAASSSTPSPASAMTPSTSASMLLTPSSMAESPAQLRSRRSLGQTVEAAASGGARTRSKGTFSCCFCGIIVSRVDSLTRHVKRKHPHEVQQAGGNLGLGPLRLPGFSPPRQSPVASTSASIASSPGYSGTGTPSSASKRMLCPLCGLSLSRTDSLVRHIKKQHGEPL